MPEPEELLPALPSKGPPIPRGLEQRWPFTVQTIFEPPFPWRLHWQREGIRKINEVIALYERHERELDQTVLDRLKELHRIRDSMVRRAGFMARFRR